MASSFPPNDDCEKSLPAISIRSTLATHAERFRSSIQLPKLRSQLMKHAVISQDELDQLMSQSPERRTEELMKALSGKPDEAVLAFVRCLKDSQKHADLVQLLEEEAKLGASDGEAGEGDTCGRYQLTSDRLAVFVCLHDFITGINTAEPQRHQIPSRDKDKLKTCLASLGYDDMDLGELIKRKALESCGAKEHISILFNECIRRCREETCVFILVMGNAAGKEESVVMEELVQLVQLLPTSLVTMVIDCHGAPTNKQQLLWAELTRWNSRSVIYSICCNSPKKADSPPLGLLTEVFVKAFIAWLSHGSPATVTHRHLYEQISYWWHGQKKQTCFSPFIQGDVDRVFLGVDGYPYRQWLRADLTSNESPPSPRERFDLTRVHVRTSKMAGLILDADDVLDVFHICRPEEVFKGKVKEAHQMYAIVEIENVEDLKTLLEEEYRDLAPPSDSSMDFLCLRKSFPLHLKQDYTVHLDLDEEDSSKLKGQIGTSPLLTSVNSSKDAKITVKKEGHSYTIEDNCGDVTYRPKVKNLVHVASLLEMMAWYKHVKAIHTDTPEDCLPYSCFLTLDTNHPLPPADSRVKVSSHTRGDLTALPVVSSGGVGSYWEPLETDRNPHMYIIRSSNCVVTAVDIKVQYPSTNQKPRLVLKHSKVVFSKKFACNGKRMLLLEFQVTSLVMGVSLERSVLDTGGGDMWNLQFSSAEGKPVLIGGSTNIAWSDFKTDFLLGVPTSLSKLEIRAQGDITGELNIVFHSSFVPFQKFEEEVWTAGVPKLIWLNVPVEASIVQLELRCQGKRLWPLSIQAQLCGMTNRRLLEVVEGDRIRMSFMNHSPHQVHISVLCLEETGKVQFMFGKKVLPDQHDGVIIATTIAEGHNVPAITDTYKVFVCPKMMCLEPYIQRGLHEYCSPLQYNVCARFLDSSDQWGQYEFKVQIRKAKR